ncbi:MAG TPA: DinB family protein [Vicinamibacterales bacterium]|nr:DinB family protein [Vicinamibacterales bacterium]
MDPVLSRHVARVRHLRESFAEANERFVARLRRVDDHAAQRVSPEGGWTAAQIGWHVARVTTRFAGLLSGDLPGVEALPDGFEERDWSSIVARLPPRLKTSAAFEPPAKVTRDEAVAALEASGVRMAQALDAVTIDRGARFGITSPIVGGFINLYQVGEWATAHVIRHNRQAKRVLGEG